MRTRKNIALTEPVFIKSLRIIQETLSTVSDMHVISLANLNSELANQSQQPITAETTRGKTDSEVLNSRPVQAALKKLAGIKNTRFSKPKITSCEFQQNSRPELVVQVTTEKKLGFLELDLRLLEFELRTRLNENHIALICDLLLKHDLVILRDLSDTSQKVNSTTREIHAAISEKVAVMRKCGNQAVDGQLARTDLTIKERGYAQLAQGNIRRAKPVKKVRFNFLMNENQSKPAIKDTTAINEARKTPSLNGK